MSGDVNNLYMYGFMSCSSLHRGPHGNTCVCVCVCADRAAACSMQNKELQRTVEQLEKRNKYEHALLIIEVTERSLPVT